MSEPRQINVLQLISNLDIGGAQEVVLNLAVELAEAGHTAVVGTFRDGPLRADLEARGIHVVILPRRARSVLAFPSFIRDLLRIRRALVAAVSEYDIDVIQTHLLRSLDFLVAATFSRRTGPLVYWTFHNYNFTLRREHLATRKWLLRPKQVVYRQLHRRLSARVAGLVAVSDEVREAVLDRIGPVHDKVFVIPNGVDIGRFAPSDERDEVRSELSLAPDQFVIVMVGTFKRQKGHAVLVEALETVTESHPEVIVLLIGDGELRSDIEHLVARAGLGETVRFLGSRRDIPRLLAAADGFVLPSLWEGLPMALLEAMACGLPCVATRVSGTEQVILAEETGILVSPGDAAGLAAALVRLLDDPAKAEMMGAAGRRRIEMAFSARTQAQQHLDRFQADLRG